MVLDSELYTRTYILYRHLKNQKSTLKIDFVHTHNSPSQIRGSGQLYVGIKTHTDNSSILHKA